MIKSPSHILVIKSNQSEIEKVESFLKEIFDQYEFAPECFNKVFLCVSEAVVNSIIHGNKKVAHKEIEVQVNCEKKCMIVTVTDEGDGFDISNLPDPTKSENILKESGRGIHIIRTLSHCLNFNEKGNSLQFQINC